MEQQVSKQTSEKEEIDLLKIGKFFYKKFASLLKHIGTFFKVIFIFLLRKSLWLLLFIAAGLVVGTIRYKSMPKIYRSEIIVRSNNLPINLLVEDIAKLNTLCVLQDYNELSALLNISELDAAKIQRLTPLYGLYLPNRVIQNADGQPMYYTKKFAWRDTLMIASSYLKVQADVLDENVYANLTQGLLYFLTNSNAYGHKVNTVRMEQLKSRIEYVEHEIGTLQQIQATQTEKVNATLQLELTGSLQKSEPIQLHEAINDMYNTKINMEREVALFPQPITLIADFSKSYRPVHSSIFYMLWDAAAIAAIGFIALLLWDNRKQIVNTIRGKT
jgi:hypothetical protein